jgi:hypothetical protein
MKVGGQRHASAALPPGNRPGTNCIGGWVGTRAVLDGCGKSHHPPGFGPRTVQPVASHYTNWAIPAHIRTVGGYSNDEIKARKKNRDPAVGSCRHGRFLARANIPYSEIKQRIEADGALSVIFICALTEHHPLFQRIRTYSREITQEKGLNKLLCIKPKFTYGNFFCIKCGHLSGRCYRTNP